MHKYQPRIHLVLWRGKESQSLANAPITQLEQETHKTFIFSETIFTAVTAYQNHSVSSPLTRRPCRVAKRLSKAPPKLTKATQTTTTRLADHQAQD